MATAADHEDDQQHHHDAEDDPFHQQLITSYKKRLDSFPTELQDTIGVLFSIVTTISEECTSPERKSKSIDDTKKANPDELCDHNGKFIKLAEISSLSFLSSLMKTTDFIKKKVYPTPVVINSEDFYSRKLFKSFILRGSNKNDISPLEQNIRSFELEALIRLQVLRILSGEMPLRPAMSEVERGIKESELLTFTSLSPNDLYRSNQLQECTEMILRETKALPNFTGGLSITDGEEGSVLKRKYFKTVPAFTFAQILNQESITEPMVLKKYYNMTDELLYCLHWPPPDRRNKKSVWQRTILEEKPSLEDEVVAAEDNHSHAHSQAHDEHSHHSQHQPPQQQQPSEGKEVLWETLTMMPAGQMIAMVHRFDQNNQKAYFNAYLKNYLIGFRINALSIEEQEQLKQFEIERKEKLKKSKKRRGSSQETNLEINTIPSSTLLSPPPASYHFFVETPENIRILSYPGKLLENNKKPDKNGTICLQLNYPNDLRIQCNSNGNMKIETNMKYLLSQYPFLSSFPSIPSKPQQQSSSSSSSSSSGKFPALSYYFLFPEKSRFITENGEIFRKFEIIPWNEQAIPNLSSPNHFFEKEILSFDGNRDLFLIDNFQKVFQHFQQKQAANPQSYEAHVVQQLQDTFEFQLLSLIPPATSFIRFTKNGEIQCFDRSNRLLKFSYSSSSSSNNQQEQQSIVVEEKIDAESRSKSKYFIDGRLLTEFSNGIQVSLFPDCTKYVFNPNTKMLTISRHVGFPEIEFDVDVDSTCRKHAQGMEIPINKGGERVRSRLSLPDGTAIFIKYDTRVTTKVNGSIRCIRRDRTSIVCQDDGTVTYAPSTTWTDKHEEGYRNDCKIDDLDPKDAKLDQTNGSFSPSTALPTGMITSVPSTSKSETKMLAATPVPGTGNIATRRARNLPEKTRATAAASRRSPERKTPMLDNNSGNNKNAMTSHEVFTSNHEPDATITVNLVKGSCLVEDYEFNTFDISLNCPNPVDVPESAIGSTVHSPKSNVLPDDNNPAAATASLAGGDNHSIAEGSIASMTAASSAQRDSPLNVIVQLAGEVPGLKPPAVARSPKPPRVFILTRSGDATEVLSVQDIRLYENQAKICGDVIKYSTSAVLPPSDLGPATLWSYFTEKKFLGSYVHGFLFQELFGPRIYQSLKMPASSLYFLYGKPNLNYKKEFETGYPHPGRVFECVTLLERSPISQEGYQQITLSIQRCEEFRQKRMQSIDRFAVEDPRTPEQIKEEEEITKRLKQAYKMAKVNAAKKKEKLTKADEDEDEEQQESQGGKSSARGGNSTASPGGGGGGAAAGKTPKKQIQATIKEVENEDEDGEEEDEEDHFGSDDEEEVSPEEAAVKAAFDDFSMVSNLEGFTADVIPISSLQEAFIRIVNQFIGQDLIDKAILDTDEVDMTLEEFTFPEFRLVYRSLLKQLQYSEEQKANGEDPLQNADDTYTPYIDRFIDFDNADNNSIANNSTSKAPASRGKESYFTRPEIFSEGGQPSKSLSSTGNTTRGFAAIKSAPPLNLSAILNNNNKNSVPSAKSGESKSIADQQDFFASEGGDSPENFAAGQPLNAVRRAKTMK